MLKDIAETLRRQHKELKIKANLILKLSQQDDNEINCNNIADEVRIFNRDLTEHLTWENNTYYPRLLKEMEIRHFSTENIRKFIMEMDGIVKEFTVFFERFRDASAIEKEMAVFKTSFAEVRSKLILRIGLEEDGIFG